MLALIHRLFTGPFFPIKSGVWLISPRKRRLANEAPDTAALVPLDIIVEEKFVRMRSQAERIVFFALGGDPHVQKILSEDIALEQEIMVLLERSNRFIQAAAHLPHTRHFFGRQVIKVFVHRLAGVNFVLDAIESGHEHPGKGKVWVCRWIGRAILDPLGFW